MTLEIHAMFSEDRYRKTDKNILLFFSLKKTGNFKSLDHQEKDKLQILKEIVCKHEKDLGLHLPTCINILSSYIMCMNTEIGSKYV